MSHKGDMTTWDEIGCQRGCADHPTRLVDIHLGGPTRYRDLTPIPERFAMDFQIEVWDTDTTPVDGGPYCPARDAVSETIISHGVWEPRETTVLLLCLEAAGGGTTFVDVGAQVGWFSTLCVRRGCPVLAVEADLDAATLLHRNLHSYGADSLNFVVHRHRVGPGSVLVPPFSEMSNDWKFVVKIDIEGAEAQAIEALADPIELGRVPFILMEVSPVFNDSYPELVTSLMDRSYHAYLMPPKSNPPVVIDQLTDLLPYRLVGDSGEVAEQVAGWHQEDLLLVLGGVEEWT